MPINQSTIRLRRDPRYVSDAIWINFGSSKDSRVGYDGTNDEWTVQSKDAGGTQTDRVKVKANQDVTGIELYSDDPGASGIQLDVHHDSASPAAADVPLHLRVYGEDSGGTKTQYAGIKVTLDDPTDASEDATVGVEMVTAGTLRMASFPNITADDTVAVLAMAQTFSTKTLASPTITGVTDIAGGSAAAPSLAFTGDLDTGIYSPAANQLGLTAGGVVRAHYDAGGVWNFGGASRINVANGTASLPGYGFDGDADTGMYRSGADVLGFAAGGVQRVRINGAQLDLLNSTLVNVGAAANDWTATLLSLQDTANIKIGATTARATTEPTNGLTLFNGTVPAGTLANGVTLYAKDVSSSAELHVMDEAGNETLLSPHDPNTGEWIFYSRHSVTGRVIVVRMERLVKRLEETFGWGFVEEFMEEGK